MNSLRRIFRQNIFLFVFFYAMIAIGLNQIAPDMLFPVSVVCIILIAQNRKPRHIVIATTGIILLHIVLNGVTPSRLSPVFLLHQIGLIAIAGLLYYLNQSSLHSTMQVLYDNLFEQNNDGIFLLDLQGNHLACNQRAVDILGYDTVAELTGVSFRDIVVPDEISSSDNVLERLLHNEFVRPYERTFRKKNGDTIRVEVNVQLVKDAEGKPQYLQSIIRDISARKEKEQAIQESEIRFRTFFEHSPVAMWQLDYSAIRDYVQSQNLGDSVRKFLEENPQVVNESVRYLKIDDINHQVLNLYRVRNKEELLARLINNIKHDPVTHERNREVIVNLMEGKTEFELNSVMSMADETILNVVLRFKVFPGSEKSLKRILVSQTDISELTSLEVRLAQSQANAEEFQVYLTRLHYMTIRLGRFETLDELYQAAVQAARTEFDFSRVALFIADYDENLLRGTYGTSPDGEIRPEHDYSEQLHSPVWFDKVIQNQNRATFLDDIELFEYGETIGKRWKAIVALWSGNEALGYIVVDNYLTGYPPRPFELDLLSLFSGTLGHLIARRRALQKLETSRKLLDSTFASLTDAVFLLEKDTALIEDCNPAATILLGYKRETLLGCFPDFTSLGHPSLNSSTASIQRLTATLIEKSGLDSFLLYREDGSSIYADVQIMPLNLEDTDSTTGWVMVIRDMTERKAMEQELINLALEKERVTALQQLISKLRHDIATPLSSIKTNLYILGRVDDEEKRTQRLGIIDKQVDIIHGSLESVTAMTRVDVLLESDLDKNPLILNNLLTSLHNENQEDAQRKQQTFILKLPSDELTVSADKQWLRTAIEQLIFNALQYTPEGGTITLTLESEDKQAIISVKDTGIGIEDEDLPYIFDRLYRGQEHRPMDGSTGIGLPVAKRLIELHRGRIDFESEPSSGSTFSITLPLAD